MTEFKATCKTHWRFTHKCEACENDAQTLKTLHCKEHEYETSGCTTCMRHHTHCHALYRPALYDCGYCQQRMRESKDEEKRARKLAGIEKRRQTMAERKKSLTLKK